MLQAAGWALWFSDQIVLDCLRPGIAAKSCRRCIPRTHSCFSPERPCWQGCCFGRTASPRSEVRGWARSTSPCSLMWWLYLYVSLCDLLAVRVTQRGRIQSQLRSAVSGGVDSSRVRAGCLLAARVRDDGRRSMRGSADRCRLQCYLFLHLSIEPLRRTCISPAVGMTLRMPRHSRCSRRLRCSGESLSPTPETAADGSYNSWMANLAMIAVLSLPIMAFVRPGGSAVTGAGGALSCAGDSDDDVHDGVPAVHSASSPESGIACAPTWCCKRPRLLIR